jgi:hypothetical protein
MLALYACEPPTLPLVFSLRAGGVSLPVNLCVPPSVGAAARACGASAPLADELPFVMPLLHVFCLPSPSAQCLTACVFWK